MKRTFILAVMMAIVLVFSMQAHAALSNPWYGQSRQ